MNDGVIDFDQLGLRVREWQSHGLVVALCHGCFDPLHVGHIDHFAEASTFCDRLIVTVTQDRFVNKGPERPWFSAEDRARAIAAIKFVSAVAINPWSNATETLTSLRPDLFVKGSDYSQATASAAFQDERAAAEKLGIGVRLTVSKKISATELLRRMALAAATSS